MGLLPTRSKRQRKQAGGSRTLTMIHPDQARQILDTSSRAQAKTNEIMAGYRITPVLVFWTKRELNWVKFTFETGFELPSSCPVLPGYAPNRNRNILDFMRWPQNDLGAQDLNGIQRPKSFQNNSWK